MRTGTTRRADRLASELRQVLGVLIHRLRAESTDHEISMSERAVLRRLLEHGPTTTAALARAEWVTPQSMGATLARLADGRYISRTNDAADGRRSTIAIARRGRQVILAGRAERQGWLARAIDGALDPAEQRTLASAISCLRRLSAS
jgi:DNA-binding MarR family transcriptional regulator